VEVSTVEVVDCVADSELGFTAVPELGGHLSWRRPSLCDGALLRMPHSRQLPCQEAVRSLMPRSSVNGYSNGDRGMRRLASRHRPEHLPDRSICCFPLTASELVRPLIEKLQ
jgi:hypothetical protein